MEQLSRSRLALGSLAATLAIAGCGEGGEETSAGGQERASAGLESITEDNVPAGFEPAPEVKVDGQTMRFDEIPGHYWHLLDDDGTAVGFHFQEEGEAPSAEGVEPGELLYIVQAIPGNCGDGNYGEAIESADATEGGGVPPGFDHWHAFVDGGSERGTWLSHIPVRDFTFAGPPDNPLEGTEIKTGQPKFLPVCDIR